MSTSVSVDPASFVQQLAGQARSVAEGLQRSYSQKQLQKSESRSPRKQSLDQSQSPEKRSQTRTVSKQTTFGDSTPSSIGEGSSDLYSSDRRGSFRPSKLFSRSHKLASIVPFDPSVSEDLIVSEGTKTGSKSSSLPARSTSVTSDTTGRTLTSLSSKSSRHS